jgi:hypothetical protein
MTCHQNPVTISEKEEDNSRRHQRLEIRAAHLKNERTTSEIYRKTIELEVVKRATEMSTGLLKMRNWTLWRKSEQPRLKNERTTSEIYRKTIKL